MEESKGKRDLLWVALILCVMLLVMSSPDAWWDEVRLTLNSMASYWPNK